MAIHLHNISPNQGAKKKRKVLGRGNSSGLGKTSGRGMKGQKSRSGVSGLKKKGLKATLMRLPKFRGVKPTKAPLQVVNLSSIEQKFEAGQIVSKKTLWEKGLISSQVKDVKILGDGKLTKALTFETFSFSKSALDQIEKTKGTIKNKK